nr:1738_t:CDS:2 [Entrophospora candida]CAG8443066.1 9623_t:CDS:2 [Entrophospora candida]
MLTRNCKFITTQLSNIPTIVGFNAPQSIPPQSIPPQNIPRQSSPPSSFSNGAWGAFIPLNRNDQMIYFTDASQHLGYVTNDDGQVNVIPVCIVYKMISNGVPVVVINNKSHESSKKFLVDKYIVGLNHERELKDGTEVKFQSGSFGTFEYTFKFNQNYTSRTFNNLYTTTTLLGKGSFGQVFLCLPQFPSPNRYAAKLIEIKDKTDSEIDSLRREIKIMNTCNHHRLVKIFNTFHENNLIMIVMECMEGGDLFTLIQRRALKIEETRYVFTQILEGVKPSNILMCKQGSLDIKIIDFGLSKILDLDQEYTATVCGSPAFAAPELLAHFTYSKTIDMWSAGVILYMCLVRDIPFKGKGNELRANIVFTQLNLDNSPNSLAWRNVDLNARDLVVNLLEKFPSKRLTVEQASEHVFIIRGTHHNNVQEVIQQSPPIIKRMENPATQSLPPAIFNRVNIATAKIKIQNNNNSSSLSQRNRGFFKNNNINSTISTRCHSQLFQPTSCSTSPTTSYYYSEPNNSYYPSDKANTNNK